MKTYLSAIILLQILNVSQAQFLCITTHCFLEVGACVLDSQCFGILNCIQACDGRPDEPECIALCDVENGNENFRKLTKCMVDNGCLPEYQEDGICLATDDQALQITDLELLSGDWWVLKGKNCGQDDVWRGGYDW